ncbi:CYTH domain-containing protein [Shouchella patagoniensis]|uniref:CYTH domain-containing protein n=1 Tax=Shouchella patagoniensis TaxID=228576 RepID=UPI00099525FD|nr:CYTH domain-containing protein [Shouchella patagoniensis]
MTQEMEYEAKSMLTKTGYNKLIKVFPNNEPITQQNDYFDTLDFTLKQKGAALRVRHKKDTHTLTLKQSQKDGLLETHQPLTAEQINLLHNGQIPDGPVKRATTFLLGDKPHLHYFGSLKTIRTEINYRNGTLCLDHSLYNNTEDFEIEFEGSSIKHAEFELNHLLQQVGLESKKAKNKVARFFDHSFRK